MDDVDFCCRSLHKCDAYKHTELNKYTNEMYIRHCDCVHSFQICLKNLNTSLSNQLAFIHSINATKCYAQDYPAIECINHETYPDALLRLVNSAERERFFNRCLNYDFDFSQLQKVQMFDVPFNNYTMTTVDGMSSKKNK